MPSDSYQHHTTNNFKKLINLEAKENTAMITASVLMVLHMYIGPTWLLEDSALSAEWEADGRLYPRFTSLDWDNNAEIKEDKDNKDKEEDHWKRSRRLKREK